MLAAAGCDIPSPYHMPPSPKQGSQARVPSLSHANPYQPWTQSYYSQQAGGYPQYPDYHQSQAFARQAQYYSSQQNSHSVPRITESENLGNNQSSPTQYGQSVFSPVKGHSQLIYA